MLNTNEFKRYDYGPIKNRQVYGQAEAPFVPLDDYNIPTVLLSGDMDTFATPEDVAWLSEQLGDKVVYQQEYHKDHFTFVLGKDMTFFS